MTKQQNPSPQELTPEQAQITIRAIEAVEREESEAQARAKKKSADDERATA